MSTDRTDRVLVGVLLLCVAVWGAVVSLPFAVWVSFVSVLVGAAVTGFFSWHYYQRASEELRTEAEQLRHHTALIMQALEAGPPMEFSRDPQTGEPVGNVYTGDAVVRWFMLEAERQEAERQRRKRENSP